MPSLAKRLMRRLGGDLKGAGEDLQAMLTLRWELARLEISLAVRQIKALAIVLAVVGVVALVSLSVLTVAAALWISVHWHRTPESTLFIVGAVLLVLALLLGFGAVARFRRRFRGLEDSIAELQEDAEWLKEWAERMVD